MRSNRLSIFWRKSDAATYVARMVILHPGTGSGGLLQN